MNIIKRKIKGHKTKSYYMMERHNTQTVKFNHQPQIRRKTPYKNERTLGWTYSEIE